MLQPIDRSVWRLLTSAASVTFSRSMLSWVTFFSAQKFPLSTSNPQLPLGPKLVKRHQSMVDFCCCMIWHLNGDLNFIKGNMPRWKDQYRNVESMLVRWRTTLVLRYSPSSWVFSSCCGSMNMIDEDYESASGCKLIELYFFLCRMST